MTSTGTPDTQGPITTTTSTDKAVRPFTIAVDQADLDDLADRLARTRLPRPAPGDDWEYGTPERTTCATRSSSGARFDWRAHEARMNAVPHYLTEIDGQTIHFVHVRSPHAGATPLILAHTYPGSFVDYLDMIGPLIDPVAHGGRAEDAFDVVVPRCRASGSPTPVTDRGWTMARVARAYDTLMRRLGYDSLRHPRQRQRRAGRPRARTARPATDSSACTCCSCSAFPRATRASSSGSNRRTTRARAHAVVPVGGRLQHHERLPPADHRGRAVGLAGRAARLQRAVQLVRQRHEPRAARADPHRGLAVLVRERRRRTAGGYHYEEAHAEASRR